MKSAVLLVLMTVIVSLSSFGQNYKTAIGIKGGWPYYGTVNLKHDFGGAYGEFRVGGYSHDIWIQALFEKNYGLDGGLEWYWGVGGHVGFWDYGPGYHPHWYRDYDGPYNGAYFGADGVIGLEYTFEAAPINLAVDFGPTINFFSGYSWVGWGGALAARFAIK
jgi:hypothetical protein